MSEQVNSLDDLVALLNQQRTVCLRLKEHYANLICENAKDQYMNEGRLEFIAALLKHFPFQKTPRPIKYKSSRRLGLPVAARSISNNP